MTSIHITANSRLSAALKQNAVLANQVTAPDQVSNRVIETPKAMTLAQWWQEWQNSAMLRFQLSKELLPKKVLNNFEAQWLFEQCLQEELLQQQKEQQSEGKIPSLDGHKIQLLNISATAKQLYQAWTMLCEYVPNWQSDGFVTASGHADESELLKRVLKRYLEKCEAASWQDNALFAQFLLSWLEQVEPSLLPNQFELHGFDDLTPNMRSWIKIVQQKGCKVLADNDLLNLGSVDHPHDESQVNQTQFQLQLASDTATLTYYSARDPFDEVQQVALWSMQQLHELTQHKPIEQIKIAIVAPDIAEYKTPLIQALDETLFINGLSRLSSEAKKQNALYNISLGEPLHASPLVENALKTLDLFLQPNKTISFQDWSEWLISVYTFGDLTQRQQADADFRRLQWANLQWAKLLATDSAKSLPQALLKKINQWQESFATQQNEKVNLLGFVETVYRLLDTLGWPGSRSLNSEEYQQKTAFEHCLAQFSGLMDLQGKQSFQKWLSLLKRYLAEQVHQAQSTGHQPIQVMGMLEAGGQTFDALWIMGLTNEAWPRMANPNPFIPSSLQRHFGMPRSDAARELQYAQQLSQRLVHSTNQVFCSYPQQIGEARLLPSAIFPVWGQTNSTVQSQEWSAQDYLSLGQYLLNNKPDDALAYWQEDTQGLPLAEGSKAPGGTGILQAQRKCPLMAYIDYRLGAKYGFQQVEESLQNTNQGSLIHRVLELFWLSTETQVSLLSLSNEERQQRLQENINQAFNELQSHLSEGIEKVEKSRILELCLQWLNLETERESFTVKDTEKELMINLAGMEFKIIVDRIDAMAGESIIIDYKTGRASINDLLHDPINAPQLAVYLFALEEQVAGIGYGLLHSDDGVKLNMILEDEGYLGEAMHKKYARTRALKVFTKMSEDESSDYYQTSWQDFLDHLKNQVLELASQIQQGYAPMLFEKPADIQYAEGYLALRVPEVMQQLAVINDVPEEFA